MKKLNYVIIMLSVLCFIACKNGLAKQEEQATSSVEKPVGQIFAEAYQNQDWETVVAIGDTLIDEKDTMYFLKLIWVVGKKVY